MNAELRPFDITNDPTLRRLVEEVRSTNRPLRLRQDGEDVAEVRPVTTAPRRAKRAAPTQADRKAFFASFGAWKGIVDVARLKRDLAASRRISRPAPEL